jgi:uncharacterized protein YqjF (DUF2071 family)
MKKAGTQKWRDLLFQHWTFPVEVVQKVLPPGLEVDAYGGEAWVGVVPFAMRDVKPRFAPFGMDFLETNLRTYVRCGSSTTSAVWFFSLEAESRLAVAAARATFGLPYHFARMKVARTGDRFVYSTDRRGASARHAVTYTVGGPAEKGPLETFLVERYELVVARRGRLFKARVRHVPYPIRAATVESVDDTLGAAAGLPLAGKPRHALYSEGVDVDVFALEALGAP